MDGSRGIEMVLDDPIELGRSWAWRSSGTLVGDEMVCREVRGE